MTAHREDDVYSVGELIIEQLSFTHRIREVREKSSNYSFQISNRFNPPQIPYFKIYSLNSKTPSTFIHSDSYIHKIHTNP